MSNKNKTKIESIEVVESHEDPQPNFYSDADQKIKNHSYEISLPDIMMEPKTVKDIPPKFFKDRGMYPMPYQGIIADRDPKLGLFRRLTKYANTVGEDQRDYLIEKVNSYFPANPSKEMALVTQCVRTMWDLYLQVKKFPKGSEIIFTGVTIPDMVRIAEEHGLVCVPVDLDLNTLMPSLEDIKRATSPKSVAMIFAYLFGATYDIAPYVPWLNENKIEIIEDCAQSF